MDTIEAAAIIATNEGESARLVAYVSLVPGHDVGAVQIKEQLARQLPEYMVPTTLLILDKLPMTANGKIDRLALPEPEGEAVPIARGIPPRDHVERQLAAIWMDTLNLEDISVEANFFELGGHSILAMNLMVRIQKWLGGRVPVEWLFQGPTIAQLAEKLRGRDDGPAWSCLVAIGERGEGDPLFLIHPAGGNVFCYAELGRHLDRPLYGLQSPGLDPARTPLNRIEAMAERYLTEMRARQPQGPYHLGGWSLGGVVAFEMAQRLAAMGQEVALLVLIDSYAPTEAGEADLVDTALVTALARDLVGLFGRDYQVPVARLAEMEAEARLDFILDWAKDARVIPPDMTRAQLHRLLTVFEKNLEGLFHYVPGRYDGPLILFSASEGDSEDPALGWAEFARCRTIQLTGDHYSILKGESARQIAAELNRQSSA
jgi:thioesterase domain-containing protein/acyl carrier protein